MGGRAGNGTRNNVSVVTMGEVIAAQKAVSTTKAQYTKAQNALNLAMGEYYMAQKPDVKTAAAEHVSKAQDALTKAQAKYKTAQKTLESKVAAYQNSGVSNSSDNDIPLF